MDQRTHAWIAVRAIALLEDENDNSPLVRLLKPHARTTAIGAWIPDKSDAKRGGSRTDNHILKIKPITKDIGKRFLTEKKELLKRIGKIRKMHCFLNNDSTLTVSWWKKSYKGDVSSPGQHLVNRAMALSTSIKDMLLLGNEQVDILLPGKISFINDIDSKARASSESITFHMMMLSHFIADSCMPCHCDNRDIADYAQGLHKEWENDWSKRIGNKFSDKYIKQSDDNYDITEESRKIDSKFGICFSNNIPDLVCADVWLEFINVCRASFAISSIVAPPDIYPYGKKKDTAPFKTVFSDAYLLDNINSVLLHDAVINTAMVWKHIWNKCAKD